MTKQPSAFSLQSPGNIRSFDVPGAALTVTEMRANRPDDAMPDLDPPSEPAHSLVLNVDGDAANRARKTRILADTLTLVEAEDASAAIDLIARQQPLLVLLEVASAQEGVEACRRIKAIRPGIMVIQIAPAAAFDMDPLRMPEGDADYHLTAPVAALELVSAARAMLRLQHARLQAREAGERYRAVVDNAADTATFICREDGQITDWSAGAQAILGHAASEAVGTSRVQLLGAEASGMSGQERPGQWVERWQLRRDGTRFWCRERIMPLRDSDGTVVEYICLLSQHAAASDAPQVFGPELEGRVAERTRALAEAHERLLAEVSERDRAGERRYQIRKMQALAQLTGGIAHDFNNLLTAILGGLELSRRRIEDVRNLKLIDGSISAAQRGARLITQLMAFARRQSLQVEYLYLNVLLNGLDAMLRDSVGPAVRVTYDLAPDLWPVMADPDQVRMAVLNLATNAGDAMPDGGILRISTCNTLAEDEAPDEALPPGGYVSLMVHDHGVGMSDGVKARLFEPFFSTKGVGKGAGLGLAQVYGFVRQSGGDVRVHSMVGSGTTITILLPRAEAAGEGSRNSTP